jgi:glycosyltransferase involved in cell wall biosynthesis
MTTLRLIVDQILAPVPGGIGRYTEELARALIRTAPRGSNVAGVVAASPQADYDRVEAMLPGMSILYKSALTRRQLSFAWQHGFTQLPGSGMLHAPSVFAPLSAHDRVNNVGDQVVVTIHDVVPWTHPETLTPHGVRWHKALVQRAFKYADAVVVDTHAVANQLSNILDFGDRVRVISAAVSSHLRVPDDAKERAEALELPERYVLSVGTLEPRKGIGALIKAMSDPALGDVPLLIVGPDGWGGLEVDTIAKEAGLAEGRVRTLGYLPDRDLAVALDRATVFAFPSLAEGFGLPVLEAFSLGTAVVHSDDAAVSEVSAGAGLSVPREDSAGYPARLAEAIASVLHDDDLRERMGLLGIDRAKVFSWSSSAEKVWQLHADL